MKAGFMEAPRRLGFVDEPVPRLEDGDEGGVIVRTRRTAICGSDMPLFEQERPRDKYPLAPPKFIHECMGTVAESRSARFREGDRVLALPRVRSGLAEYFETHESVTIPLPEHEREDCLLMAQPLGTVIWALRKLPCLLNMDTVVLGQGPNGLLFTHMLSNLGARRVIAVDLLDYRLEASRRMRATHTVDASREDPVEAVKEITAGAMADVVVEAVGHQTETINQTVDLAKRGGTVVAFGVPDQKLYEFRYADFFRRNLKLVGSVIPEPQVDFSLAATLIAEGRVDVRPMITHHLPFTEAQRGFELSLHKRDGAIKIVFEHD